MLVNSRSPGIEMEEMEEVRPGCQYVHNMDVEVAKCDDRREGKKIFLSKVFNSPEKEEDSNEEIMRV